jgi:beta-1,4-mannosyltransferase
MEAVAYVWSEKEDHHLKKQPAMRTKAYMYPVSARLKTGVYNPYIDNFMDASDYFLNFVNREKPSVSGVFDMLKYIFKIELLFLNWVENLPDKKGGIIQALVFLLILHTRKLTGIKVIWTMHNKFSHSPVKMYWKKMLFRQLLKNSDLIITHATDGIDFAEEQVNGISSRILYFQHPVVPKENMNHHTGSKLFDILIWGSITPYKGIDTFLEYANNTGILSKYRVVIAGKCQSNEFFKKIIKYESNNCIIINRFISEEELEQLISQSKIILFTYSSTSVLSSGALIDSVAHYALVAGPHKGAFKDLAGMGVIKTYVSFDELPFLFADALATKQNQHHRDNIKQFLRKTTWPRFAKTLHASINALTLEKKSLQVA